MFNKKNNPGNSPGNQRIDYSVGFTALGEIFVQFTNGEQHFKCTMDEITAAKMGAALVECAEKFAENQPRAMKQ